jgi:hypothetical protein
MSSLITTNPETGKAIKVNADVFKKLLKKGYAYNSETNTLEIKTSYYSQYNTPATNNNISPQNNIYPQINISHQNNISPQNNILPKINALPIIKFNTPHQSKYKPLDDSDLNIVDLQYNNIFSELIHISDIHIPINIHKDRSTEYEEIFNKLYELINIRKCTCSLGIIITGDLLHTKLNIVADTILIARKFLSQLASIAPTIVILGNHDFTQNNVELTDLLTAICHEIKVTCLIKTGIYQFGNILLSFSSLLDNKFIHHNKINNPNSLPIYKLFHGSLVGSSNDNGTIIKENNMYPLLSDFDNYDAVLLGHIHKHQFIKPHIAYAGSLIQQNYGEPIDNHGMIIWNIATHRGVFIPIENNYIFINIDIINGNIINKNTLDKYKYNKIRIKYNLTDTTVMQFNALQESLYSEYNIIEFKSGKKITTHNTSTEHINIPVEYDIEEKILKMECNPILYNDILELHNLVKKTECKTTCIDSYWCINSVKFKNMFIYGNDVINIINFDSGVYNICSPNKTGKSSIIYVILFALYAKISSSRLSNTNIVFTGSKSAFVEIMFTCNGNKYIINRTYSGVSSVFTSNFAKMSDNIQSYNSSSKTATEFEISNIIGTYDHFITHNILSKMTQSLISMPNASRITHLNGICNTKHYATYRDVVMKKRTEMTGKFQTAEGKLFALKKIHNNYSVENTLNIIKSSQCEKMACDELIANLAITIQDKSTQIGIIENNITHTNNNITENNIIPNISLSDINCKLHECNSLLLTLQQYKSDHTTFSLEQLIKVHSSQLIPCDYTSNDISTAIDAIKNSISLLNIPNTSHNELLDKQITLQHDIDKFTRDVDNSYVYEHIDISCEHDLLIRLNALHNYKTINITTDITQLHNYIDSGESTNELSLKIMLNNNKIQLLNSKLKVYDNLTLTPTEHCDLSIKPLHSIGIKHNIDVNRISQLQLQLENICIPECDAILTMLNSIVLTDNSYTLSFNEINDIKIFVNSIADGTYNTMNTLHIELTRLCDMQQHNMHIDALISENNNIVLENNHIQSQINWLEHNAINLEINNLIDHNKTLEKNIIYNNIVSDINSTTLHNEYISISHKLHLIHNYKLLNNIKAMHDELVYINTHLKIYDELNALNISLDSWNKHLVNFNNNINTTSLLDTLNNQLTYSRLCDEIAQLHIYEQYYINIETVNTINTHITLLQQEINSLTNELQHHKIKYNEALKISESLNKRIIELTYQHTQYDIDIKYINELTAELNNYQTKLTLYDTYITLFSSKNIPSKIMLHKLSSFNDNVNSLFSKYTKYTFNLDIEDHNNSISISLFIIDKLTNNVLDAQRLCGYEYTLLQLSLNQAIINVPNVTKSSFLIIDEGFDCVDQHNFIVELPDIITSLKQLYNTIIIVSQRDIPNHIIDDNIKIIPHFNDLRHHIYSTIQ